MRTRGAWTLPSPGPARCRREGRRRGGSPFFRTSDFVNAENQSCVAVEGWVLYDADCRWCVRLARRFRPWLAARHFELLPLQTPWVQTRLGLPDSRLLDEMRLLLPDGKLLGGADALLEISGHCAWPFRRAGRLPAIKRLLHVGYGWVARHRGCAGGACDVRKRNSRTVRNHPRRTITTLFPLLALPLLALGFRNRLAPWVFMWAMAFALYAGCKWVTYREAVGRGLKPGLRRSLGYLLAWPGMDAAGFLNPHFAPTRPRKTEWTFAAGKTVAGAILLWGTARTALPVHPLLAGWIGMAGAVLVLHFGSFHLLALAWRRAGVGVTPVMDKPVQARSLAEFWGRRWNTAFNELAFRFTFRPLNRRMPLAAATLLVFGLSGLVHELVISLPARGGYGLPTAYFLAQGLGVLAERTQPGRRLGLGRGMRGRLLAVGVAAGPAFGLFHPPFIQNVILPMLTAIGAT
jgi:predicted DCC family thiol-disulfide oxidoreductase YuxK